MKLNKEQSEKLQILRHSAAHLLAQAVTELFPKTKLTIGPATKDGFFYDFQPESNFKESDLEAIEKRMKELASQDIAITHEEIAKDKAREIYKDNPFKMELIEQIPGDTVGFSRQGDFYDLCRGGHVTSTKELKAVMLTGISGSYWRADQNNAALQRISGIAFFTDKELRTYLKQKELAAKYDHRKLGKDMDLFSFQEAGTGFPFYHPKGAFIINQLKDFIRSIWRKHHYQEIITPSTLDVSLWQTSGHYDHYKNHMYFSNIENKEYAIKPMNCPGSILIYKQNLHSYRDLPLKLAEFGHVHRFELSGVLHGLFRTRAFTIDDTHIYCTPDQIEQEIVKSVKIIDQILTTFGFQTINYAVSTKPDNAMGDDNLWETATAALRNGLKAAGKEFAIYEGEGAFYGPKIEVTIHDSMGREWQCSTIQADFFLPKNFALNYIDNQGKKQTPVIIHQALLGSLERFFGIILEHFKGHLPFWLAPTQVTVIPITSEQEEYANNIYQQLKDKGIRTTLNTTSEPLSAKIKSAQLQKTPWMLVAGQKEVDNNTITLRHVTGKQEFGLTLESIIQRAEQENHIEIP